MESVPQSDQRVTYSNTILFEKSPAEAMEALSIRKKQIKTINKELAEWLTLYGRQRLNYVDELKKVHAKGLALLSSENAALENDKLNALGLCQPLWSDTLKLVQDEIVYLDQSTRKMGREMIAPLKLFTRNNDTRLIEMTEISDIAANIKACESDGRDPTQFFEEWSRRAPDFFATFEAYDYERLILLKDIFSNYQSDVSDVLEAFKKDNQAGLEHVLNFNMDDEVNRFSKDVIEAHLPIENVALQKNSSKSIGDGFTSSRKTATNNAAVSNAPGSPESHRSHGLFHLKNKDKRLSSNASSMMSNTTTIGPGSHSGIGNDKKEKTKIRSKFGSIFKGKNRKNKKASELGHPGTINESDAASVATSQTAQSLRTGNREQSGRAHSISSANRLNGHPTAKSASYQAEQRPQTNVPVSTSFERSEQREPALDHEPIEQAPPTIEEAAEQIPPAVPEKDVLPPATSHNVYQPMTPTKRTESYSTIETPVDTPPATNTYPSTSSIPQLRGMTNIPENGDALTEQNVLSENLSAQAISANNNTNAPPPLPISRKHIANEIPVAVPRQQPHGIIPTPPQQRKSLGELQNNNAGSAQQLQPAPTGSSQAESTAQTLAHNTTGGGGLATGQIIHPSLTIPGLNASIVELFNASFKNGELVRSNAIGEIAFSFINETNEIPQAIDLKLTSKGDENLPNFMVNPMFLEQTSIDSHNAQFKISDPYQLLMRTVGGLKYMLNNPVAPILVTPIWKHEENQSTVIISIKPIASSEIEHFLKEQGGSIKLTNVLISASIQNAIVSNAATKPSGTLNKDKGRVTWLNKEPLVFTASKMEERYVARFITNQKAKEADSGVQLKFNIASEDGASELSFLNVDLAILAKGDNVVEDPFTDGIDANANNNQNEWLEVPTLKSIVSGSYTGHSE